MPPSPSPSILLLPTTTPTSYTHPCIPVATAAITRLLTAHNFHVTVAPFSAADLVTFFFPPNPSKDPGTPTDPDHPIPTTTTPTADTSPTSPAPTNPDPDLRTAPTTTSTTPQTTQSTTNTDARKDPLAPYTLLILLHSAGDFLPPPVLPFFQSFLSRGGAIVAIHGAATGMPSLPLYGSVLGGVFKAHPAPSMSTVQIVGGEHPIIRDSLGKGKGMRQEGKGWWEWEWYDEWYAFETDPREVPGVEVLISGGGQGAGYPVAWCREGVEGERGRVFYTALGHFEEAYEDEGFMGQVLGGVMWALDGGQ